MDDRDSIIGGLDEIMRYSGEQMFYTDVFECFKCKRVISSDHYCKTIDFCPYCGAYMDNTDRR